ncbi:SixA phosphatase family protein [Sphingobacterium sp. LRF_L2]|uniref:SixA phosphatase family protein n=1 Tax=Sphingobacterium sp. LRF_L2 TaxID=3369421 RepID=UPI003F60E937
METKSLYIIRHAKAEEYSFSKKDFDRDLIDRGVLRATQIAQDLKKQIDAPAQTKTLIISSTANRAAQTARIFCDILAYPQEAILWEPSIYEAHYLMILKALNDIPSQYQQVLVFGHNPGLSDFIDYIADTYVNLKTSHAAFLQLEPGIDYSTLSANTATLKKIFTAS